MSGLGTANRIIDLGQHSGFRPMACYRSVTGIDVSPCRKVPEPNTNPQISVESGTPLGQGHRETLDLVGKGSRETDYYRGWRTWTFSFGAKDVGQPHPNVSTGQEGSPLPFQSIKSLHNLCNVSANQLLDCV